MEAQSRIMTAGRPRRRLNSFYWLQAAPPRLRSVIIQHKF
jgi:hypothetical protein